MSIIKKWAVTTFILSFFVIIAGGIVRTTQSGMGCPDWPKCFGSWIPPTNASQLPPDFEKYLQRQDIDHTFNAFHTWTEYINRLSGALLGLFGLIQFVLLFLKRKALRLPYKFSVAYLAIVLLTGLFGAMVVKLNLADFSISVHLLFAIILLQIQLGLLLSLQSKLFVIPIDRKIKQLFFIFLTIILIQSILGTGVRIYVDNVSKTLHYEQRETWLASKPLSFLIHKSFAWIVLLMAGFTYWKCRNIVAVRNKVLFICLIILMSVLTGITLFYLDMPAVAQPIHLFLASCAITLTVSLLMQTRTIEVR